MSASQHGQNVEIIDEQLEDCTVLHVGGELDFRGTPVLYAHVERVWGDGAALRLVIDLAGIRFCDSAGLGALVHIFNKAKNAGGRLVLVAIPDHLRRRMRISGLESHFEFHDTIEEAVVAVRAA
ncbi:STAS domain-containing protein [Sphaerisporangium sp. TRM90804]|uniref:STAS domain-containing protein n=1 Tax=Sphaerisporangium sp. TRM90804 TaxID=3031113 RepID=UPI00244C2F07|nr:STAS domain-containing protein [Sphaerisporangium sp. TRM90804]MDH2426585.1 STAS domain-containing protein [Sphaerisporangium sp. TRM90804]